MKRLLCLLGYHHWSGWSQFFCGAMIEGHCWTTCEVIEPGDGLTYLRQECDDGCGATRVIIEEKTSESDTKRVILPFKTKQ